MQAKAKKKQLFDKAVINTETYELLFIGSFNFFKQTAFFIFVYTPVFQGYIRFSENFIKKI